MSKIKSSLSVLKQQEIIIIEQILLPELDISPLKYFLISTIVNMSLVPMFRLRYIYGMFTN